MKQGHAYLFLDIFEDEGVIVLAIVTEHRAEPEGRFGGLIVDLVDLELGG